jgi:endonuclease YncB( thermonuclease family)
VDRVIDGDTLKVIIDVGFPGPSGAQAGTGGIVVYDKLRLRGINCPELGTPDGDKAKRYVEKLLPPGSRIILKSHKSGVDKYGRFVVDTFYKTGCDDAEEIIASGTYLNQELLDEGYAVRMAE